MGWMRFAAPVAAVLAAAGAAGAQATNWSYEGSALQHPGFPVRGASADWVNYFFSPTIGGQPLNDGMKLYGYGQKGDTAFYIPGFQYIGDASSDGDIHGNRLIMFGTGEFDASQWVEGVSSIQTSFNFNVSLTGGFVNITTVDTRFDLYDANDEYVNAAGTGGFNAFGLTPGSHDIDVAYLDDFGSFFKDGTHFTWQLEIKFDWLNQSENDFLTFRIPPNSIDLQVVPAPGAATLLGVGALAAGWRRRRA